MLMDWGSVCKRWHNVGLETLKKHGKCPFLLQVYPETSSECTVWMEPQGLDDRGRDLLRIQHGLFRKVNPAAVLLSSDTWQASDKFFTHFGLLDLPFDERNKRYLEILDRDFKGSLANVPDKLKGEALVTSIKGPRFHPLGAATLYHREKDKVVVDRTLDSERYYGVVNLVPDWWESVLQ